MAKRSAAPTVDSPSPLEGDASRDGGGRATQDAKADGRGEEGAGKAIAPLLIVTCRKPGFRRAGRAWSGRTEIYPGELTEAQIEQLRADPLLTVEGLA